uniref:Uncharacterized protein n=1 Tax=Phytophthora infestans TaxID=4787 RepID=Q572H9_PHYIN|nr:hypothetical protein PI49.0040c [Phytophthora infestans]
MKLVERELRRNPPEAVSAGIDPESDSDSVFDQLDYADLFADQNLVMEHESLEHPSCRQNKVTKTSVDPLEEISGASEVSATQLSPKIITSDEKNCDSHKGLAT